MKSHICLCGYTVNKPLLLLLYVIRDITTAESDGAISDEVCTEMNESSTTVLECALRCECRVKKTVKSL